MTVQQVIERLRTIGLVDITYYVPGVLARFAGANLMDMERRFCQGVITIGEMEAFRFLWRNMTFQSGPECLGYSLED